MTRQRNQTRALSNDDARFLPPHEPTLVPGFHAYSERWSVRPGESLDVRVSSETGGEVKIDIVRHGASVARATVIAEVGAFAIHAREIHRGSFVFVKKPVRLSGAFSFEVWFRPLAAAGRAGLMCHPACTLWLDGAEPAFVVRTRSGEATGKALPVTLKEWHHAVVAYDGRGATLYVDGVRHAAQAIAGKPRSTRGPQRIGALDDGAGVTTAVFTGDLHGPAIYSRSLSHQEISGRHGTKASRPADDCVGHWAFDAIGGPPFRDTTRSRRHAQGVNFPIRMIPGPRRTEDSDWCGYDPTRDKDFGYAVRCMPDAIADCRWPVTATWRAPAELPSGQYAARVTAADGQSRFVHFIVRPRAARPTVHGRKTSPRVACLSTTSTRCAYNFQPFGSASLDYGAYQRHPSYPVLGQLMSWRRPSSGEPWETTTVNFELPFYAWLCAMKIPHDVFAEWDIEADPSTLDGYGVVAWAGHSEYWTAAQYETLRRFRDRGGHLLAMSGNTAFWRVSLDLTQGMMEVRKHDRRAIPGVSCDTAHNAAHHHQLDLMPGTYMHASGFPQATLGLGQSNGFTIPPLDGPRADYEVLEPDHELFLGPHAIQTTGSFAPRAAGYETDLSLRSMLERFGDPRQPHYPARDGSPPPTLARASQGNTHVLARARIPNSGLLDYDVNYFPGEMWAEMLWSPPRRGRGATFASGSVLSSEILLADTNFSNFMLNVLDRMGVAPAP